MPRKKPKKVLPPPAPPKRRGGRPPKREPLVGTTPAPEPVQAAEVPPMGPPPPPPVEANEPTLVETLATWVHWYNTGATPDQQNAFDRAASVIDNGGTAYQRGGPNANYVENWRSQGPDFYAALVNYRDTGGRRALFAVPAKDYGPRPISVVKQGGPIEALASNMLVLHPGRYTYTDVTANGPAFRDWLGIVREAVTVGQTQVSAAVCNMCSMAEGLPAGAPYYVDYEFTVSKDTAWPTAVAGAPLHGTPTWLPMTINIVSYWGQVTTSKPDWGAPGRAIDQAASAAASAGKGLLMATGLLAAAYLVFALKPAPPPPSR